MKIIVCAALAASCSWAGATVYKCVDQDGHVLFTDQDCAVGRVAEDKVELKVEARVEPRVEGKVEERVEPMPAPAPAAESEPVVAAKAPVLPPVVTPAPRSRWADLPHPLARKDASVDAMTLQAARQTMLVMDEQHKPRRLFSAR